MLCNRQVSESLLSSRFLFFVVVLSLSSTCVYSQNSVAAAQEGRFERLFQVISGSDDYEAEILYLQSKMKQSVGEHDEAMQLAELAVKANPKKAAFHLQLASVLSDEISGSKFFKKISLTKRIRSELDTALKLEPANPDCLFGMMMYYEQAPGALGGSKSKAHELANQIAKLDTSKGYLAHAQLSRLEKRPAELEDLYLSAVKADPTSFDALASLASFYASEREKNIPTASK